MATANAIEVSGLTKKFGSKLALHDVSFSVPQGKIIGFLGPNGAGKTTAIRCLMDFIHPTSGTLKISGKDAHANSTELKGSIGFLPSDNQLNLGWTSADHLDLATRIRGGQAATRRLIELLELDTRAKVKSLSTGNKQKLSIILAFTGTPQLLIMDEPTKGLDPVLQNTIYEMLAEFAGQGKTVFFSSHNLAEVQRICDSVILIKDGKVIAQQSVDEIRGANTHVIRVTTKDAMSRSVLDQLGAEVKSHHDHAVEMTFRGDLNLLMRYLTKLTILDLSIGHASLEDLFLEMYKD